VDESDELGQDEEPAERVTERVKIFGAEPAGTPASGGSPSADEPTAMGDGGERPKEIPRYVAGEPSGAVPLLPHWTDPPTGQVPAIVDRRGGDAETDPLVAAGGGPSWREHEHEWDDGEFDAALLADDDTRVGALDERPLEERRPWEFEDFASGRGEIASGSSGQDSGGVWAGENRPGADVSEEPEERSSGHSEYAAEEDDGFWAEEPRSRLSFWGDEEDREDRDTGRATHETTHEDDTEHAEVGAGFGIESRALRESEAAETTLTGDVESPGARSSTDGAMPSSTGRARGGGSGEGRGAGRSGRSVPVAIATGVGFALVALLCFLAGALATLVLATIVVTLAVAECYAAIRRSGRRPATLLGLVATVGLMISAYDKGVAALPLVMALVVVTSMVWYLVGAERGSATEGITSTIFGFAWVGVLGSFAALMLAPSQYPHGHGVAFLLGAVVATVAADVGALAIGGWLGRRPLAPRVSPHKTWEGTIGGGVVAIAASVVITGQVHPWTPGKAAVLGLVVAVIAPIGDLCESLVKRDLGLKDMGSILPGHGGILDRFDALLFALPATYYLVRVLHLG
jgi:phosphatidate cytidylyltransferase